MPEIRTPSNEAVQRIQRTVRRVERMPHDLTGHRRHTQPGRSGFWAMIEMTLDQSIAATTGRGHTWHKVIPNAAGTFWHNPDGVRGEGSAHNASRCLCPPGTVVLLQFVGFVEEDDGQGGMVEVPQYTFSWGQWEERTGVPVHDHRDSHNGGFAFSVYHPGTALPQMPWAL